MFREIPEYSRFSRFVATLPDIITAQMMSTGRKETKTQIQLFTAALQMVDCIVTDSDEA